MYPKEVGLASRRQDSRTRESGNFLKGWLAILAVIASLTCGAACAFGQAEQPTAAEKKSATTIMLPPSPKALLPDAFDGWVTAEPSNVLTDAAQADAANAAALKEYGFTAGLLANYKREGDTLSVRALRFDDASGAYGAYSFYRQNGWPKEAIGDGAASDNKRVLFWKGNDGGGCNVFADRAHVRRRDAGDRAPVACSLGKPGARAADIGQSAPGFARPSDDALCAGAGGLRRSGGGVAWSAAAVPGQTLTRALKQ